MKSALIVLINEASRAGARQAHACRTQGLSARTVQRWQRCEPDAVDARSSRHHEPCHKASAQERAELLAVANSTDLVILLAFTEF
ncbi:MULTISPECIES: hypothetical protein [unclassified Paraburkholderia]|uniref:hypothetical protein n=1 Tax=unclassified Paraburkholderia TaxID=2615204 RepID=UPI002AB20642|nr:MULTISPECIES: hypothetical protein [unclassified Paraburkholderia]